MTLIYSLKWCVLGRDRLLLTITVVPSFLPTVRMFNVPGSHTQSPTVYLPSGGWTGRHLDQGRAKAGEIVDGKSPEQRGEVRERLVRVASNLHCLTM